MQSTFLRRVAAPVAVGAVTAGSLFAAAVPASAAPNTVAFKQACQATALINQTLLEDTAMTIDAPESVSPGEQFTYRLEQPGSAYPDKESIATTTNISRFKLDFMIPENATFVSAAVVPDTSFNLGGVAPNVLRVNDDGAVDANGDIIRLSGNNEVIANGGNNNAKAEGGIVALKTKKNLDGTPNAGGDSWFKLPAIDVTVIAGDSGEIQPKLRTSGEAGNYNNNKNFSTFLPKASAFGTQWAPTRCVPAEAKSQNAGGPGAGPLATIDIQGGQVDVDTATVLSGATEVETGGTENFTATIVPADATGSLQLTVDGANAGAAVAVTAGQSEYTLSNTFDGEGTFDVKAVFTADAGFSNSTSAGHSVTVTTAVV
ncbi:Ig-like domain-containing protein, partial [Tomitella biformata]